MFFVLKNRIASNSNDCLIVAIESGFNIGMPISFKEVFNQVWSHSVFLVTQYFAFALEQATTNYFLLLHVMKLP